MKKIFPRLILILSIIFLTFNSCDVLNPNSENGKTTDDKNAVTIGVEGGTILGNDISVIISPGTFKQNESISLTETDTASDNEIITKLYSLKGIPENYSLPIKIEINIIDSTADSSYLVVKENNFTSSADRNLTSDIYLNTKIYANKIVAELPPLSESMEKSNSLTKTNNATSFSFFGITHKKIYMSTGNHFKIIYNESLDNLPDIIYLAESLERAYTKIKDIGFNFNRRTKWPIRVICKNLAKDTYGLSCSSKWGLNNYHLEFNRLLLSSNQQSLSATAIHEFFHIIQALYDPRSFLIRVTKPPHQWLNEACSVWSEELLNGSDYISDARTSNTLTKPFEGMQSGSIGDDTYHGYGMAPFIKYLVDKYGKGVLVNIYDKIFEGRSVLDAINNSINYNLFMDYGTFLNEYVQGKLYKDINYSRILASKDGLYRIQSTADSSKSFTNNYNELSAKIFLVRLDDQNLPSNTSLNCKIDQNMCELSIFSYPKQGGDLQLIATNQKECIIQNLENITTEGKFLIVMVTNLNYKANNYIPSNLDIKLDMKLSFNNEVNVEVYIDLDGCTYKETSDGSNWEYKQNESFIFTPTATGLISNNVFNSNLDDVYSPLSVESSSMTIELLANPNRINIECDLIINDATTGIQQHRHFSIDGIPEEDAYHYWEYGGGLQRAKITDVYTRNDNTGNYTSEFVSTSPSENSKVEVIIK